MTATLPTPVPGSGAALDVEGFRRVLDGVRTQVLVADADLVIRYINPPTRAALERLLTALG